MNRFPRFTIWPAAALLGLQGLAPAVLAAQETAGRPLSVTPERVEIRAFYGGETIRVEGQAAAGSQVIVIVRGPDKSETFNKKVRAGPIWISSGKVHIEGAPSLFLSFSPAPPRSILDDQAVERYLLDPEAIKSRMHVDAGGDPVDIGLMRDNYLALREGARLYQIHTGRDELAPDSGRFALEFRWPRKAPPATYEVFAYECRDKQVVEVRQARLVLVEAGFPEWVYQFAHNSAALYGLLAVFLAVGAGFGIDFLASRIFGGKVRAAH